MTMRSKKRPFIVQVTLNGGELAFLKEQAELEGLTMTAYLRRLVIKNASSCLKVEEPAHGVQVGPDE